MDAITLVAAHTALLVVDVQEKLLPAMPTAEAPRLLRAVDLLLDAADRFGLPTWVTEQYPSGLGATVPELRARLEEDALVVRAQRQGHF